MTDTLLLSSDELLQAAYSLPDQVEHAVRASRGLEGLPTRERVEHVVVIGMGAAGIAGDILQATAGPFMPVPVTVVKSYELPAFVGEGSLVFAISASGNTEETIEAATEAAVQGAKVVAITRGGRLGELAGSWGAPVVHVPRNVPSRAAIGALATPAIAILEEVGLFVGATQWIDLAVEQLRARSAELTKTGNVAERIASAVTGKLAIVHGGGSIGAAAAKRWKAQLNTNARVPAFWAAQPELSHNDVMGWDGATPELISQVVVVSLRHDDEHPQVTRRFELTHEHLAPFVAGIEEVRAEGDGALAQLLDLVMIGDVASILVANRSGVDTSATTFVSTLKNALREH